MGKPGVARRGEPRFDRDVAYGRQGELQINEFYEWIANGDGRVETKRKDYLDHRLYVETHHDPGRRGEYSPSGITTTAAHVWCFVIGDTGIHVAIPTDFLREMLSDPSSRPKECCEGSCPTRGMLIDFCVLLYRVKRKLEAQRSGGKHGQ